VPVDAHRHLLLDRLGMEAGGLAERIPDQVRRHAVIDDEIEADMREREAQLAGTTFPRPRLARKIGPEVQNGDGVRGRQSAACASFRTS
jgi:hypothetical protein